jgi:hypothetical protein
MVCHERTGLLEDSAILGLLLRLPLGNKVPQSLGDFFFFVILVFVSFLFFLSFLFLALSFTFALLNTDFQHFL